MRSVLVSAVASTMLRNQTRSSRAVAPAVSALIVTIAILTVPLPASCDDIDSVLHWPHPECRDEAQRKWPGMNASSEQLLRAAKCGALYSSSLLAAPRGQVLQPTRVALLGKGWGPGIVTYSGCPNGTGGCPGYPNCEFVLVHADEHTDIDGVVEAANADVVIFDTQHLEATDVVVQSLFARQRYQHAMQSLGVKDEEDATWIFYWREAKWELSEKQQLAFDLEMGVHFFSDILNPPFVLRPTDLLASSTCLPFSERSLFAASAISHCHAASLRDPYIDRLEEVLGAERVHRYGACGNLTNISHDGLNPEQETWSRYKFYLSFENTIESGYVTEKLFTILKSGAIPVYLGAPDVPPIVKPKYGPAFINVLDFSSPDELAEHLLAVASDEGAFMRYQRWRKAGAKAFDPKFLKLVARQLPPFFTMMDENGVPLTEDVGTTTAPRRQQCCRACDRAFLNKVKAARAHGRGRRVLSTGSWNASYTASMLGLPPEAALLSRAGAIYNKTHKKHPSRL